MASSLGALLGCQGLNSSNGIVPSSLSNDSVTAELPAISSSSSPSAPGQEDPSLTGLDRRNWQLIKVSIIRGEVESRRSYSEDIEASPGSSRSTGTYPNAMTALAGDSPAQSQFVQGVIDPLWVPVLFLAAPVRMLGGETPWQVVRYPQRNYEVVPSRGPAPDEAMWRWVEVSPAPIAAQQQ